MKRNCDYILFAVKQAKEAEKFGFTRNECCRNLKTAIHQYWQNKELGMHGQAHKKRIPRSNKAKNAELRNCVVEHSVPQMVLINNLMDMENIATDKIEEYLNKHFCVRLITKEEDKILNSSGLRSKMPDDWDGENLLARYEKVGILFSDN